MRSVNFLFALAAVLALTGCHSAYIEATISNRTSIPLSLIEVDYPSASFGTQTLAPGQDFHYRFKVLGNGGTTILWTGPDHRERKDLGPLLHEGDEGKLIITFNANGPNWDNQLTGQKNQTSF